MIRLAVGGRTDVGRLRAANEDGFVVEDHLVAVADGMGGHRGGETASASALEALAQSVRASVDGGSGPLRSADELMAGVEQANVEVFRRAGEDPELSGMGTTLCAVAPVATGGGERLGVVNVGDSRVYLWSEGSLQQLTEDHSLVEILVRQGQLTPEQAAVHPKRNVVTRALGIEPTVDVDCWAVATRPGDRFLLCSDGLVNEVDDAGIGALLAAHDDPVQAADALVAEANAAGGRDNITVVVVDVVEVDPPSPTDAPRVERLTAPVDDLGLAARFDDDDDGDVDGADDGADDDGGGEPVAPVAVRSPPALPVAAAPTPSPVPPAPPAGTARRRRPTWRVVAFVAALAAVVGVALGATWWAARHSYFVKAADNGSVVVYRGRPGGLLWWDEEVVRRTDLQVADLPESERRSVNGGKEFTSLEAANRYVDNLVSGSDVPATTVPATSTTSTTSTTTPTPASTTTAGGGT